MDQTGVDLNVQGWRGNFTALYLAVSNNQQPQPPRHLVLSDHQIDCSLKYYNYKIPLKHAIDRGYLYYYRVYLQ